MQTYNFLFFLSGNLTEVEVPASLEKVQALLLQIGAQNIAFENAGRQKMAYPTGTHHFGYLINSSFEIESANITTLQEKLSLDKEILRFMVSKLGVGKKPVTLAELAASQPQRDNREHVRKENVTTPKIVATEEVLVREEAAMEKEEKSEDSKEEKKKVKMDLNDINKKIDEILQQDDFVV